MPPKNKSQIEIPPFPPANSEFTFNSGFRFGLGDAPPQLGQIPIPEGAPGCLQGLVFVATGTLPSLKREDLQEIIEKYGGRMTGSISGRTNVVIRGCIEVGPKKLEDAKKRGLTIIDEPSLLQYLASTNPDWKPPAPPSEPDGPELPTSEFPVSSLWTEKYRPRQISEFIGNSGAIQGLKNFFKNKEKCALVSGPPGVGKTTAVTLVAMLYGYKPQQYNASDHRSRKVIQESLSTAFDNKSINSLGSNEKMCLVFDEVDGMGAGDHGGIAELVERAKTTNIPMICITNDRDSRKIRTLAKVSSDIQFVRPTTEMIQQRITEIAVLEDIQVSYDETERIAQQSNGDFRHAVNALQFLSAKHADAVMDGTKVVELVDPASCTLSLFNDELTMNERLDRYFADPQTMPTYVYENLPFAGLSEWAEAMEYISAGDLVDGELRLTMNFSLQPAVGLLSCVGPSVVLNRKKRVNMAKFPQLLARSKKQERLQSLTVDIYNRVCRSSGLQRTDLVNGGGNLILARIKDYIEKRSPDVESAIEFIDGLELFYDDVNGIKDLLDIEDDSFEKVSSGAKSAMTRKYKSKHPIDLSDVKTHSEARSNFFIKDPLTPAKKTSKKTEDLKQNSVKKEVKPKTRKPKTKKTEVTDENFVVDDEKPKKRGRPRKNTK